MRAVYFHMMSFLTTPGSKVFPGLAAALVQIYVLARLNGKHWSRKY